jgi:hypothetical protein
MPAALFLSAPGRFDSLARNMVPFFLQNPGKAAGNPASTALFLPGFFPEY